mgnify:CR=1 FL=1
MTEREALLNIKEKELAAHEQIIVATLRSKDEEIEELVKHRTQKLADAHKEAMEAQILVSATKLKEVADGAAIVVSAKADLEAQAGNLKEELTVSGKEVEALKAKAQKTTLALEEL